MTRLGHEALLLAIVGIVFAAMAWLSRAFEEYSAEVGYYEGTTERWHIGQPTSVATAPPRRLECTTGSTMRSPVAPSPGPASSPETSGHLAASLSGYLRAEVD